MRVLVACEESQRVCTAFRKRGHQAFSCDILDCSGGHPEWHIKDNVLNHLDDGWDLIIAHPPCTYLTVAGNRWFNIDKYGESAYKRLEERTAAIKFFMEFVEAPCEKIAIENPVGVINSVYRKPDQIIQPFQFGHPVSKKTCLWLKNLPKLKPTIIVSPEMIHSAGKSGGYSGNSWHATDENGKIIPWDDPRTAIERSKTFEGVAEAMAEQWGGEE